MYTPLYIGKSFTLWLCFKTRFQPLNNKHKIQTVIYENV